MSDDFFAELGLNHPDERPAEHPEKERSHRRRAESREERRARQRRKWRSRLISLLVLTITVAGVYYVGKLALANVREPSALSNSVSDYPGPGDEEVIITIPDGATGSSIAEILEKADVVATTKAFVNAFNANSNSGSIQAGTYTLKTHMAAADAVAALLDPSARADHTLTIPEGFTKGQVKARLVAVGEFTEAQVEAAYKNTSAIGLPAAANGNVEGWLAPGTYTMPENVTAEDLISEMVARTTKELTDLNISSADYETTLTKASIIEREVSNVSYYSKVARVLDNRLADTDGETKGYLQMDSTVLYGLGRTGGIPTSEELADASNEYNTYQHAGLPPSPIGSPGLKAINAVLSPADGNWLFFVTVNLETGETLFADTLDEQKENIKQLNQYCKENDDICSGNSSNG